MQVTEFRDALARGPGWTEEQLKERAKLQQQVGTMKIASGGGEECVQSYMRARSKDREDKHRRRRETGLIGSRSDHVKPSLGSATKHQLTISDLHGEKARRI
jgi:hypothetical protein